MKKLLIAAAVAGTMVSGVAFASEVSLTQGASTTLTVDSVVEASLCSIQTTSDNKVVDLDKVKATELTDTASQKEFTIVLENCHDFYYVDKTTKKNNLKLTVEATSEQLKDANQGTLNNIAKTDAASNVLVQLLQKNNSPLVFTDGISQGLAKGSNTFTLKAQLKKDTGDVTPGLVKAQATLKFVYE